MSRTKSYPRAIIKYLQRHRGSRVTKKLNEIYEEEFSSLDSSLYEFKMASIDRYDL